ncbi:potassium channel family protein [Actinoplanes sp. NPDC023936]|uniref:potassium channel family protein n=1 Tax=Actinoplanes sp. NPDC023936 TaxID=3154910 RepID=UPI0033CDD075
MKSPPARGGYGAVLVMILATYVLALLAGNRWMVALLLFVQSFTVWHVLRVAGARAGFRRAAALVFLLALVTAALNLFAEQSPLIGWTFSAASALYLLAPYPIVRHLGRRDQVDRQTVLGALAAYLLIGMAFGFAYECLAALQPGPLFGAQGDPDLADALFFSFVTMTTTGYGNLVPAGNPAQSVAVLEALVGQLFLVTAVAKVVENWRPRRWRQPDAEKRSFTGDDAPDTGPS